jgi:predicted lipoprotein with Yx(FWY)xxD motif
VLNPRIAIAGLGVIAVGAVSAAVVGGSNGYGTAAQPAATATVHSEPATVGGKQLTVLAAANGLPLYYYAADTATSSRVTGGLAGAWPPVTSADSTAPSAAGLSGRVTVVHDAHGNQVAYNGHLLYTFVSDRNGVVTGQGVQNFFVATPGLGQLPGSAPAAATTNPASGGYGY